jgi:inward rectifier potassium channel
LITGLLFAKFSQPIGRLTFATRAVVTPFEGKPTLMFRLGNERGNSVVEAQVRVDLMQTRLTAEGVRFYRMTELTLVRSRIAALSRSWSLLHVIDPSSPLHGASPETLAAEEAELHVSVTGTDDTSGQVVHGQTLYESRDIVYGARFADVLTEEENGDLVLDIRKFDDVVSSRPTDDFPYEYK